MKTYTYILDTGTQLAGQDTSTTGTISLSGTNSFTFSLTGIDQNESTINKIVAVYPDSKEEVVYRNLTNGVSSISAETFTKIIESTVYDNLSTFVVFYLQRDDGYEDTHTLTIDLSSATLSTYTDVNLVKCDFVQTDNYDSNLFLTFNTDDEGLAGINLINFDYINKSGYFTYNPENILTENVPGSGEISLEADTIFYNSDKPLKAKVLREGSTRERVIVKFRTRVPTVTAAIGDDIYVPAIPNTTFMHTSGCLVWHANSNEQVKTFTVPIVNVLGSNVLSAAKGIQSVSESDVANIYLKDFFVNNYYVTSTISEAFKSVSANYLFVDLFEIDACDTTICSTCSTLTAYINY